MIQKGVVILPKVCRPSGSETSWKNARCRRKQNCIYEVTHLYARGSSSGADGKRWVDWSNQVDWCNYLVQDIDWCNYLVQDKSLPMLLLALLTCACPSIACILLKASSRPCCSVLQCVAVCCSVLQCVIVCFNVLHCVAACYKVPGQEQVVAHTCIDEGPSDVCAPGSDMLQCVTVCCSVLQCLKVCCSMLQCVLQRVHTLWRMCVRRRQPPLQIPSSSNAKNWRTCSRGNSAS